MTGHLDADALASYRAGLVRGRPGRRAAQHLSTCDSCAARDASLASLSTVLAAAPAPIMPPDVAARLDAALAAASTERSAESAAQNPDRGARRRFRLPWVSLPRVALARVSPRTLAPAATVLVLIGGAAFGLSQISSSHTSSGVASGTSNAKEPAAAALSGAGAAAPRAPSGAYSSFAEPDSGLQNGQPEPSLAPGTLRAQVIALLHGRLEFTNASGAVPAPHSGGCAASLAGQTPRFTERVTYAGKQAVLVAVRRGSVYHVWIVPASCTGSPPVLAQLDVPVSG
jgi:hypothetical protein